jgi:hypothetical protein
MMTNKMFCSYAEGIQWLQNHLLACPFKMLTGYDCPGCGFQRSVIALLQGNLNQSFHYYPATIPLLLAVIFTIANKRLLMGRREYITKSLYVFTGLVIAGSYILKLGNY